MKSYFMITRILKKASLLMSTTLFFTVLHRSMMELRLYYTIKTEEVFSPEKRPWLIWLKSLRKRLKIKLVEGAIGFSLGLCCRPCRGYDV